MAFKEDLARLQAIERLLTTQQAAIRSLGERTAASRALILHFMLLLHVATLTAVMSLVPKAFLA